MKWAGDVAHVGKTINARKILVGKSEGKRYLGKPSLGERIILK